jgi:drug/metabolite transporter (DMT)-like permease
VTWYLTIRALCVLAFVVALGTLFGAGIAADNHRPVPPWIVAFFGFAIGGCILIGFGWTPEHP